MGGSETGQRILSIIKLVGFGYNTTVGRGDGDHYIVIAMGGIRVIGSSVNWPVCLGEGSCGITPVDLLGIAGAGQIGTVVSYFQFIRGIAISIGELCISCTDIKESWFGSLLYGQGARSVAGTIVGGNSYNAAD
jgi:hypothetical protein